jgi:hypothetical protein
MRLRAYIKDCNGEKFGSDSGNSSRESSSSLMSLYVMDWFADKLAMLSRSPILGRADLKL